MGWQREFLKQVCGIVAQLAAVQNVAVFLRTACIEPVKKAVAVRGCIRCRVEGIKAVVFIKGSVAFKLREDIGEAFACGRLVDKRQMLSLGVADNTPRVVVILVAVHDPAGIATL